MIDTIKIILTRFKVVNPELFYSPSGKQLPFIDTLDGKTTSYYEIYSDGNFQIYFLKKAIKFKPYNYRPAFICIKDIPQLRTRFLLEINISLPKIIYGHNFYELVDSQFNEVVEVIRNLLLQFGIEVTHEDIRLCDRIQRIDYSRNFLLELSTCKEFIPLIKKFSKGKRYTNDPQYKTSAIFKNKQQYLIIYDKVAEITSVLLDKTYNNRNSKEYEVARLLQEYKKIHGLEVLRIEHRLLRSTSIYLELKGLIGHEPPFTFEEVFSSSVSSKVLEKHWGMVATEAKMKLLILGEKRVGENWDEIQRITKQLEKPFDPYAVLYSKLLSESSEEEANTKITRSKSKSSLKTYKLRISELMGIWDTYDSRLEVFRRITRSITESDHFNVPVIPS